MKSSTIPLIADMVLIGGGHAHVHIIKMAGMEPLSSLLSQNGIRITLITNTIYAPYSGMLPGYVSGHYASNEIHVDLQILCSFGNVRLIHTEATGIEYDHKDKGGYVFCADGRPKIHFDCLSIDVGSNPSLPSKWTRRSCDNGDYIGLEDKNGMNENNSLTPVKPISCFASRWDAICLVMKQGISKVVDYDTNKIQSDPLYSLQRPFVLVVVGGGAGGIELALSAQYALENILRKHKKDSTQNNVRGCIKIVLVTRGNNILESHNIEVRKIFNRILEDREVQVYCNAEVIDIISKNKPTDFNALFLSDSSIPRPPIYFDECLWCTSAGAASWLSKNTTFETTKEGFLKVENTYECVNHPGVFAVGDCCHIVDSPRPKAGIYAVRAGPIVKENIVAYLLKRPLISHKPQKEFLGLISTGDKYAVASRGCFAVEGSFLWKLKDQIDRTWIDGYRILPSIMDSPRGTIEEEFDSIQNNIGIFPPILQSRRHEVMDAFSQSNMRCGGCGAKVGATTLSRVLNAVHRRRCFRDAKNYPDQNQSIKRIDHEDAAIVLLPENGGGAMIYTIDFFRSFVSDPFLFGKIAAVHALSDCHAMGAKPQTALALAVVPFAASEHVTEGTLIDMLSGASDCLVEEDCQLSGGHTCEGVELALGFSINGYIDDPRFILKKKGGRVGDKIILTKAIGTGALFAADMRAKCAGKYVEIALKSMTTSNRKMSKLAMDFIKERKHKSDLGIHACTDVTGFGLIGHLLEMLLANDDEDTESIDATLHFHKINFFQGAIEAVSNGILSSLHRENIKTSYAISNYENLVQKYPLTYPLLFDPQTAGGLLFFVSSESCDLFLSRVSSAGGSNCVSVIGELTKSSVHCSSCGQKAKDRILIDN